MVRYTAARGQTANNNNIDSPGVVRNHTGPRTGGGGGSPPSDEGSSSCSGGSSSEGRPPQEGTPPTEPPPGPLRVGRCKWFNVVKGWGFLTPEDKEMQEVFVHQSVLKMGGFRSLGEGEEVEFKWKETGKGLEATYVAGVEGSDCKGSQRRLHHKKKPKRIRCYNCGEFANHIAAKCTLGPQPKKCHQCKSSDHLIADCPEKPALPPVNSNSSNNHHKGDASGDGSSASSSSPSSSPPVGNHVQRNNDNNNDSNTS